MFYTVGCNYVSWLQCSPGEVGPVEGWVWGGGEGGAWEGGGLRQRRAEDAKHASHSLSSLDLHLPDTCASVACSSWPLSAPRWRSRWWWRSGSSSASSSPSCTSKTPSLSGTGWAPPWSSWARCSTRRCGAACRQLCVDQTRRRGRRSDGGGVAGGGRCWCGEN